MNNLELKLSHLLNNNIKGLSISYDELLEILKITYFLDPKNKKIVLNNLKYLVKNDFKLFNYFKSKLNIKKEGDFYKIFLVDYLKFAIDEEKFKIYYMMLEDGFVYVPYFEFGDFLISIFIKPIKNDNEEYKKIANKYKKLRSKIRKTRGDLPPCVVNIINKMDSNPSHVERWFLAVFLINYGWRDEEILRVFSQAPNYNEKKTKYFLDHIRKKKYLPYSCSSLRSFGICVEECRIKNPLSYKKKK